MENKRLIFTGLAWLSGVGGLAGYLYFRRKRKMSKLPGTTEKAIDAVSTQDPLRRHDALVKPDLSTGSSTEKPNALSNREKRELAERIKAMSPEEWEVIVDVIPVNLCLERINREIEKAAEIQASITRAYEMVKQ